MKIGFHLRAVPKCGVGYKNSFGISVGCTIQPEHIISLLLDSVKRIWCHKMRHQHCHIIFVRVMCNSRTEKYVKLMPII